MKCLFVLLLGIMSSNLHATVAIEKPYPPPTNIFGGKIAAAIYFPNPYRGRLAHPFISGDARKIRINIEGTGGSKNQTLFMTFTDEDFIAGAQFLNAIHTPIIVSFWGADSFLIKYFFTFDGNLDRKKNFLEEEAMFENAEIPAMPF